MTLEDLELCNPVYQWSYRQAWCSPFRKILDWQHKDSGTVYDKYMQLFVEKCIANGTRSYADNHITFEVEFQGETRYITFHDGGIFWGHSVTGEYSGEAPEKIKYRVFAEKIRIPYYHFIEATSTLPAIYRRFRNYTDDIYENDKLVYFPGCSFEEFEKMMKE